MKIKFPAALIAMMFATSVFADGGHDYPKSVISMQDYGSAETDASQSSPNTVEGTGRTVDSPGRSRYYPCQNMHVKMPNCPLK